MSDTCPGGISVPVLAKGYEDFSWDYGSFVNHPEYGMCYAREHYKGGDLYLRLYKMSDVLEDIKRQALEKGKEALGKL